MSYAVTLNDMIGPNDLRIVINLTVESGSPMQHRDSSGHGYPGDDPTAEIVNIRTYGTPSRKLTFEEWGWVEDQLEDVYKAAIKDAYSEY